MKAIKKISIWLICSLISTLPKTWASNSFSKREVLLYGYTERKFSERIMNIIENYFGFFLEIKQAGEISNYQNYQDILYYRDGAYFIVKKFNPRSREVYTSRFYLKNGKCIIKNFRSKKLKNYAFPTVIEDFYKKGKRILLKGYKNGMITVEKDIKKTILKIPSFFEIVGVSQIILSPDKKYFIGWPCVSTFKRLKKERKISKEFRFSVWNLDNLEMIGNCEFDLTLFSKRPFFITNNSFVVLSGVHLNKYKIEDALKKSTTTLDFILRDKNSNLENCFFSGKRLIDPFSSLVYDLIKENKECKFIVDKNGEKKYLGKLPFSFFLNLNNNFFIKIYTSLNLKKEENISNDIMFKIYEIGTKKNNLEVKLFFERSVSTSSILSAICTEEDVRFFGFYDNLYGFLLINIPTSWGNRVEIYHIKLFKVS